MNNDPTHEISVETFDRATGFNIGTVRIRTVAGDSYTGCHPSQQKMEPKTLSPPKSTNVHFKGVSNFEILKIELDTVHGDAVDLPGPHNGGTGKNLTIYGPLCVTTSNPIARCFYRENWPFVVS